jgi:Tfp pilus assembly protein PilZ
MRSSLMERRRHERHDLTAPVEFEWKLSNGTHCQGTGVTRDFSAGGLFVMTPESLAVGTSVHFEVGLERGELAVRIRAKGQVTRIEATDSAGRIGGFSISTRRMRLEKSGVCTRIRRELTASTIPKRRQ